MCDVLSICCTVLYAVYCLQVSERGATCQSPVAAQETSQGKHAAAADVTEPLATGQHGDVTSPVARQGVFSGVGVVISSRGAVERANAARASDEGQYTTLTTM